MRNILAFDGFLLLRTFDNFVLQLVNFSLHRLLGCLYGWGFIRRSQSAANGGDLGLRLPAVPPKTGDQHNSKNLAENLAAAMRFSAQAFFRAAGCFGIAATCLVGFFIIAGRFAAAAAFIVFAGHM